MPRLLTVLIDILFPPSPESLLIRNSNTGAWSKKFQPGSYKNILYLSSYQDPLIRAAIKENKFHNSKLAAKLLATLLNTHESTKDQQVAFIPIPLGRKRTLERGHNQVTTILEAAGLSKRTYLNILKRNVETTPQSHLDKKAREKNMQNVFSFQGNIELLSDFDRVILVDDVVTTGSTLHAAYLTLLPHLPSHIKLERLAIAH